MGVEAAIIGGLIIGGTAYAMSQMKTPDPKVESGGIKSIEAGLGEAEDRRRQVAKQLQKYRKATLLAKRDEPEPNIKPTTLGAG